LGNGLTESGGALPKSAPAAGRSANGERIGMIVPIQDVK